MEIKLFPLALNELLDFVRRCHSWWPEPSRLILSFNTPTAVWRFIFEYHQRLIFARAHIIQATSPFTYACVSQDARQLIQAFEPNHSTGI
jgi:hypothetical protein